MTDGEKMVWAAAFAASLRDGLSPIEAGHQAALATDALEDAAGRDDWRANEMCVGHQPGQPSDVEAALVEMLNSGFEATDEWLRRQIEFRIGRPLRGAK